MFDQTMRDGETRAAACRASLGRRRFLTLAAAAPLLLHARPGAAQDALEGVRSFKVLRDGDVIGSQRLKVTRDGDETFAETQVEIAVKLLGATLYRYALESRETWRGDRLVKLEGTCDDDGTEDYVRAEAQGDQLMIDGSRHKGAVPGHAAPTSYWSADFLRRPLWISTQSGAPLNVQVTKAGETPLATPAGPLTAEAWQVAGDLELTLYRAGGEFVGTAFDADGAQGLITPDSLGGPMPELPA